MAKSANNSQHWAILGGTFDPIHIGHLRIALQLRDLGFDKVLLIPNNTPPHRPQPQASAEQRLAMLNLACAELEGITIESIELERSEPSYSTVTLNQLQQRYPNTAFTWVLGSDAWQGFEHWHEPLVFLQQANLLVVSRPGEQHVSQWQQQQLAQRECTNQQLFLAKQGKISFIHWPELDISASGLRQALKQGDNIRFLTPDSVLAYIQQQKLYL